MDSHEPGNAAGSLGSFRRYGLIRFNSVDFEEGCLGLGYHFDFDEKSAEERIFRVRVAEKD